MVVGFGRATIYIILRSRAQRGPREQHVPVNESICVFVEHALVRINPCLPSSMMMPLMPLPSGGKREREERKQQHLLCRHLTHTATDYRTTAARQSPKELKWDTHHRQVLPRTLALPFGQPQAQPPLHYLHCHQPALRCLLQGRAAAKFARRGNWVRRWCCHCCYCCSTRRVVALEAGGPKLHRHHRHPLCPSPVLVLVHPCLADTGERYS